MTIRAFFHRFRDLCRPWRTPVRPPTNFNHLASSYSTMEITNQLKQVFILIDSNGDGKISPMELRDILLRLGHEKSTVLNEVEGMVREADLDGDGFIDMEEFMQVVDAKNEEDELREAFFIFDTDGDGFISPRELQRVLKGLGHGECSLRECRVMIRGVDKNGDGLVDFEEFRAMMGEKKWAGAC